MSRRRDDDRAALVGYCASPRGMMSRTLLITGASSGIGLAIARRFAREGSRLILAARRRDRLELLARELGSPTHILQLDVRDRSAVAEAVANFPGEFSDVDVLVNAAGLALGLEPAHAASLDDWD